MATILQLENYAVSTTVDLTNDSNVSVLANDLERDLSYTDEELITRVYTFRVTGSSKANVRSNANAFIALLRQAIRWLDDGLDTESVFLREAADGETATRMLVKGFRAKGITRLPGVDPFQSASTDIYIQVAFTLQNLREEPSQTTTTVSASTGPGTAGVKATITGAANTAPSRIEMIVESSVGGYPTTENLWIGIRQYNGSGFQHIWQLDDASLLVNNTAETTTAGSYGTNVALVSFASTSMLVRAYLDVDTVYSSTNTSHAKGQYFVLMRYKMSAAATVFARLGIGETLLSPHAYNESVLLDSGGNWRFAPMGVFQFPPGGERALSAGDSAISLNSITVQAQRLTGSGNLYIDSLTFIPYDHFLYLESADIYSNQYMQKIITHEDLSLESYGLDSGGAKTKQSVVSEARNWMLPEIEGTYLQMVMAGEEDGEQTYNVPLSVDYLKIFEAFEAYNG